MTNVDMVQKDIDNITGIAVKASSRFPYSVLDIDELISIGTIAFLEGMSRYDKNKNPYYWGFIYKRVSGAIQDTLKKEAKLGLVEVYNDDDSMFLDSYTTDGATDSYSLGRNNLLKIFKVGFDSITPTEQSILYDYYIKQMPYYKVAEKYKTKLHKVRNIVQSTSQYLRELLDAN